MVAFKRHWPLVFLVAILVIASFFRLYRLRDYLVFLGDEGRDALVWKRMLVDGKFTLLGPTASVGGFYLGPIYYYFALPFAWLFKLDPSGPAYFVATLGIATVFLVYYFGRHFLGNRSIGLTAAFLYAFAPLIVRYSRSSWNPNPLPFFAISGLMLLYHGVRHRKISFSVLAGICLGIAWQLHYLALILTPIYLIIVLAQIKKSSLLATSYSLLAIFFGWIVGFFPFLAFEIRHNFPNTRTVFEFITRKNGPIHPVVLDVITTFWQRSLSFFRTVLSLPDTWLTKIFILWLAVTSLAYCFKTKHYLLAIWFLAGMFVFSFYQGSIADYYFGFLFPVPFLMTAAALVSLYTWRRPGSILALVILVFLSLSQLTQAFFWRPPNRQIDQTETVADQVISLSDNQPLNFALITSGNSDHAYRFFLELKNHRPLGLEEAVTDQLLIVCEKPESECQPLGNSLWEIAGFGRAEIVAQTTVNPGITIYKMRHYYE